MSKRRPAHTLVLIQSRLTDAEVGTPEAMELVSLADELSRVERKWREQIAAGSERRQPGDIPKLNGLFDRLQRQLERALRDRRYIDAEAPLLRAALATCVGRSQD
jgi:hypothetical protein